MAHRPLAVVLALCLFSALVPPAPGAEELPEGQTAREHPLEPPDTSSLRATRSCLPTAYPG